MNKIYSALGIVAALMGGMSCSDDAPEVLPADYQPVEISAADAGTLAGFYVLNEGNMGANKATLDFMDFSRSMYIRNIYPERNPNVVMELGDTGNDLKLHGNKLYAVINGSHKVEVVDAATGIRIGQVNVSNPRYVAFDNTYCYVSSYVGGEGDGGSVMRFNLETMQPAGSVAVGLSPEEMVVLNGKLYVSNSVVYKGMEPTFDNTITIVDLADFTVTGSIEAAPNMHHLRADSNGSLWVSSRGNYADFAGCLIKLTRGTDGKYTASKKWDIPVTNFEIAGEKVYYYATTYDAQWNPTLSFGTINAGTDVEGGSFITDGTHSDIVTPYTIAVHPDNGDFYITDAKNYVSSGALYCYDRNGKRKWSVTTGDIPGHIALMAR